MSRPHVVLQRQPAIVTREARDVGFLPLTALVVGHTIGVGIFLTPAEIIGGLGSPLLTFTLWIGCGAVVLAGALTFGELAASFPRSGGLYVFLKEAWGERAAFLYGWQCLLVLDPGITAALAVGGAEYLVLLWPEAAGRETAAAIAMIWLLAAASMAGLRLSARVITAMTIGKVLLLGGIVVAALAAGDGNWQHFAAGGARASSAPPAAAAGALVSIFFSFGGFWEASRIAGAVSNPARIVPRALVAGVACVTALYVATSAAFIYLVPAGEVTGAAAIADRAGRALAGGAGGTLMAAAVFVSVVVSALALVVMAPRLYVEMGRDALFPAWLAVQNPRTGAPVRATVLLAALSTAFASTGTLQQIIAFFMCTALVFVALAAAGVGLLRRRRAAPPTFAIPGYPWPPVAFVLLVLAVAGLVATTMPVQAALGLGFVLLGMPAYRWVRAEPGPRTIRA